MANSEVHKNDRHNLQHYQNTLWSLKSNNQGINQGLYFHHSGKNTYCGKDVFPSCHLPYIHRPTGGVHPHNSTL